MDLFVCLFCLNSKLFLVIFLFNDVKYIKLFPMVCAFYVLPQGHEHFTMKYFKGIFSKLRMVFIFLVVEKNDKENIILCHLKLYEIQIFPRNKFYWNIATFIHLPTVYA